MSDFGIQDGEKVLFIGDSITDCGRRDRAVPLGDGYVSIFTELATARYPERSIEWVNTGIGGNRTTHLTERWQPDVIDHRPDRLSIKIGSTTCTASFEATPTPSRPTGTRGTTTRYCPLRVRPSARFPSSS